MSPAPAVLQRTVQVGLAAWLGASLLSQDPFRRFDLIEGWDKYGLFIPDWRFFAPNPGIHDFHVLHRDHLQDGSTTSWLELGHVEDRSWRHLFYHPHRRIEKTVFDIAAEILRFIGEQPDDYERKLVVSVPYVTLLNHIDRQCHHHDDTVGIQFLIAASGGYEEDEEPAMLFMSEAHPLTGSHDPARQDPTADASPAAGRGPGTARTTVESHRPPDHPGRRSNGHPRRRPDDVDTRRGSATSGVRDRASS